MQWKLYTLDPPKQWQAGTTGADQVPFYFDCGGCGVKEPVIHGFIGTGPTFHEVGVRTLPSGLYSPAMFCETCWPVQLAKYQQPQPQPLETT